MRLVTPKCIVQPLDFTKSSDLPRSTGTKQGYYMAYHLVTPCARAQQRGRVIVLSVGRSVYLFVCTKSGLWAKQASLWALPATYESEIVLYLPLERERTSGSREKQTFHLFGALLTLSTFT